MSRGDDEVELGRGRDSFHDRRSTSRFRRGGALDWGLRGPAALAMVLSGLGMPGCAHHAAVDAIAPAVQPAQQDPMDEGISPGVDEPVVANAAEAPDTDGTAPHEEASSPPAPQVPPRSGPRCRACSPPASYNFQCFRVFPCATACDQPAFARTCAPCVPPAVDLSECPSDEAERGRGASGGSVR